MPFRHRRLAPASAGLLVFALALSWPVQPREATSPIEPGSLPAPPPANWVSSGSGFRLALSPDRALTASSGGLQVAGEEAGPPLWGLRLRAVGREDSLREVGPAAWALRDGRLEAARPGLTEWVVARPEGAEHGFTLRSRPPGRPGRVVLEMALAGSLKAEASPDGRAFHFTDPASHLGGTSYAGLVVKDAAGRELPSEMVVGGGAAGRTLRILFHDAEAQYPVTVDPLLTSPALSVAAGIVTDTEWGDFDGDGDLDLAVTRWNAAPQIYASSGGNLVLWWTGNFSFPGRAVAWGDYDGDGDLDLAVGGASSPDRLYRNDGSTFSGPVWSSNDAYQTWDLAWGDYDGDGDLDLASAHGDSAGSPSLNRLFRNDPTGLTVAPVWTSSDTLFTTSLAWGDLDGDGDLDLVAGNYTGPTVLYRNSGGALATAWLSSSSWTTYDVALGDFDGDGDLDLATGNYNGPVLIFQNSGGNLPSPALPSRSLGTHATGSLAWGDWEGDGDLDLAVGTLGQVDLVYENGPTGTFTVAWTSSSADITWAMRWGDWDRDGDLDLACGNENLGLRVYQNTAPPLALDAPDWSSTATENTTSCALGDADSDGDLDLMVGGYALPLRLYRTVDGALESTPSWSSPNDLYAFELAWGDYDGDGDLDLAVADAGIQNTLWRNDGGTFTLVWWSDAAETSYGVAWGDYDGDGDLDLAFSGNGYPLRVYANGGGTFPTTATWSSMDSTVWTDVAWVDFDGDGDLDLAAAGGWGYVYLFVNEFGALYRTPYYSLGDGAHPINQMAWGDLNGDGAPDCVVARQGGADQAWQNEGGGDFSESWTSTPTGDSWGIALGDADGDGDLDLAVSEQNLSAGQLHFYRNSVPGSYNGFHPDPEVSTSGTAARTGLSWGDVDGDGDLDLAATVYGAGDALFLNRSLRWPSGLPDSASYAVAVGRPGTVDSAGFLSSPERLSGTISIPYTLHDAEGDSVARIAAEYSPCGGGQWLPATPAAGGDGTTELLASSGGVAHTFAWDAEADGADSDSVAFRITVLEQRPLRCGFPIQRPRLSAATPLFRVFPDPDGDGVRDSWDNCPQGYNPGQGQTLLGDRVWLDQDADGVQDAGEPGLAGIAVLLYSAAGTFLDVDVTDAAGAFGFGPFCPSDFFVAVSLPPGYSFSMKDQGGDDTLDSDVDPMTGRSAAAFFGEGEAGTSLDVGVVQGCTGPDEPVFISSVRLTADGNDHPILDFQDPNQPSAVTGYDVHRSADPAPDPSTWPRVASDVVDMDEATANKQWVDTSGDDPGAGGVWYYQVTAVSTVCGVRGPF